MTQSYTTIKFAIIEDVATISLSRPDAANAMNPVMARELNLAAIECEEHQGLRAVLINAEGKLFCAGGDISEFAAAGKQVGALIREMAGRFTSGDQPAHATESPGHRSHSRHCGRRRV